MKRILPFVFVIFLCIIGCQTTEKQYPSVPEEEVAVLEQGYHMPEERLFERESPSQSEIIAAVKYALSLERRLFVHRSAFNSRDQVYTHYRKGFGPEIASRLTEYSWAGGEKGLRTGERSMEVPKRVEVSKIDTDEAIAFYETPEWIREMRETKKFTVVTLKKEKGRWVIVEAKRVSSPPSQ